MAGLAILLLASMGLQLAGPQVIRAFIDMATAGAAAGELSRLAVIFVGVALLTQAASVGATYLSERVAWTATNALRMDLALHTLQLDMPSGGVQSVSREAWLRMLPPSSFMPRRA